VEWVRSSIQLGSSHTRLHLSSLVSVENRLHGPLVELLTMTTFSAVRRHDDHKVAFVDTAPFSSVALAEGDAPPELALITPHAIL
jgi:hypothetical protein